MIVNIENNSLGLKKVVVGFQIIKRLTFCLSHKKVAAGHERILRIIMLGYVIVFFPTFSSCSISNMFSAFCISVAVVHIFMHISTVFSKEHYSASSVES